MVNLAVVHIKDVLRYLIKITLIISIIWVFNSFVINNNLIKMKLSSNIDSKILFFCIDDNILEVKQVRNKNEDVKESAYKINPIQLVFKTQLSMIDNIKKLTEEEAKKEVVNAEKIEQAKTGLETQVIENNVPNKFTNTYDTVKIKNETSYNLTEEMLKPDVQINNKNIIIFHTHTCESYTATEKFNYTPTGTYRTTDLNYSVARVGKELTAQLESYNYNVIHDTTYHDYPAYTGSYGRSMDTVKKILLSNNDTDVIFDIHRDAIGDYTYAPTVKIGDEYAAQLMFVIGTDGGGLDHPNWQQNLKFAIKIQEKANELYPGLFKPIILRNSRYNQHLARGASIIEVGATGNSMEQCLTSMKYLAKVINEVL